MNNRTSKLSDSEVEHTKARNWHGPTPKLFRADPRELMWLDTMILRSQDKCRTLEEQIQLSPDPQSAEVARLRSHLKAELQTTQILKAKRSEWI